MDRYIHEKRDATQRAAAALESGMVVGLGSGSTAELALEEIAKRLREGSLRDIVGIPSSKATSHRATTLGIPLSTLERHPRIDLTIDGADEVDPDHRLLKGVGGALLWEKIIASCSRRLLIAVDSSKLVQRLGTKYPLPVEVAEVGWKTHLEAIRALGAEPALRRAPDGAPYRTDGGNFIIDARFPDGIGNAASVAGLLRARPGVLETGLFLDFSPEVIVGSAGNTPGKL